VVREDVRSDWRDDAERAETVPGRSRPALHRRKNVPPLVDLFLRPQVGCRASGTPPAPSGTEAGGFSQLELCPRQMGGALVLPLHLAVQSEHRGLVGWSRWRVGGAACSPGRGASPSKKKLPPAHVSEEPSGTRKSRGCDYGVSRHRSAGRLSVARRAGRTLAAPFFGGLGAGGRRRRGGPTLGRKGGGGRRARGAAHRHSRKRKRRRPGPGGGEGGVTRNRGLLAPGGEGSGRVGKAQSRAPGRPAIWVGPVTNAILGHGSGGNRPR